jgi:hypothetical protein
MGGNVEVEVVVVGIVLFTMMVILVLAELPAPS